MNLTQKANQGTVLESASPEGSKTTPKCNEILFFTELGQERSIEPGESLGHLQIKDLPGLSAYPQLADQKYSKLRSGTSNTNGYM